MTGGGECRWKVWSRNRRGSSECRKDRGMLGASVQVQLQQNLSDSSLWRCLLVQVDVMKLVQPYAKKTLLWESDLVILVTILSIQK